MNVKNKLILATIITLLVVGIGAFTLDELLTYQDSPELFYGETYFVSPDIAPSTDLSNITSVHGGGLDISESDNSGLAGTLPTANTPSKIGFSNNFTQNIGDGKNGTYKSANIFRGTKGSIGSSSSSTNRMDSYIVGANTGTKKRKYISASNTSNNILADRGYNSVLRIGSLVDGLEPEAQRWNRPLMDPGATVIVDDYVPDGEGEGKRFELMDPGASMALPIDDGVWFLLLLGVGYAIYIRRKL